MSKTKPDAPQSQNPPVDPRFYQFRNALQDGDLSTARELYSQEPGVIHLRSGIGETVLHFLAVENHQELFAWLLERGANINTRNDFGDTPLMDAVSLNYHNLCCFLLNQGTGMHYVNQTGKTALTIAAAKACKTGDSMILSLLLQKATPAGIESARRRFASHERLWRKPPSASASSEVAALLRQHGFVL